MAARTTLLVVLILAMSGVLASTASAFMTWDSLGLGNAEHERITRLGIACNSTFSGPRDPNLDWAQTCLDSLPPSCLSGAIKDLFNCNERNPGNRERSLRMLAGSPGYFGGVGAPDSIPEAISSQDASHCDNGDYFFGAATYPFGVDHRSQGLKDCALRMNGYMDEAVSLASGLVSSNSGKYAVSGYATDLTEDCWTNYPRWRQNDFRAPAEAGSNTNDKCKILMLVGRSFHIVEDAFSHGNWVDANPAAPSTNDAPGLAQPIGTVPDLLRYPRTADQIDAFLAASQYITGAYGSNLDGRITHDQLKGVFGTLTGSRGLNKDEGSGNINWPANSVPTGAGGHSLRATDGTIDGMDNFQRAARGAAYAAALLWTDFRNAIYARYGRGDRGELIWRAIRESTPWTQCTIYGAAARAITPPVGSTSSARSFSMTIVNRTNQTFGCQSATLDGGEWASMPPDSIEPGGTYSFRTQSNGVMTGTEGSVDYPGLRIYWNNPYWGSNDYTCTATSAKCSINYSRGNDASMTITLTPCSGACPRVARTAARASDPTDTLAEVRRLHKDLGYDVNDLASRKDVKALPNSVGTPRDCPQFDAVHLAVEDMTCKEAVKLIRGYQFSTNQQWCPDGWYYAENPKGLPRGTILCLHHVDGETLDGRREAFTIKLAHGIG